MTTPGALQPRWSSLGAKTRPSMGGTPITLKKSPLTQSALAGTCFAALREIERTGTPGSETGKPLLPISQLLPYRIGNGVIPSAETSSRPVHVHDANLGQFLRGFHRQRLQAHHIQQLKDRRVRADTQRQR